MAELYYPYDPLRLSHEERAGQDTLERQRREIVDKTNDLLHGRANWCGEFTLDNAGSATETTVEDERVTEDCEISLSPVTANAASLVNKVWIKTLSPGQPWAASPVGSFVVEHPVVSAADMTYRYSIKG